MKFKYTFYAAVVFLLINYRLYGITSTANSQEQAIATPVSAAAPFSTTVKSNEPASQAQSAEYEKQADIIFSRLAGTTDPKVALELAGSAIDYYKKAVDLNKSNDELVHKYCMAIQVKYNLIIPDGQQESEKQKVYSDTLAMLEQLHPGENNSVYANYDMALLLVLNVQYYIIFQVIGTVNRIHDLCEIIYKEDRSFEDYSAAAALGRINFLAPNILFLIGWPDKNLSRQYLEEALKSSPDSLMVKYFLADTLYALGEKDKATAYYKEVVNAEPRHDINYFQDRKTQRNCSIKMKELGMQ